MPHAIQAAAAAAAEDLKQAEERTQQAQQECSGLRTRTAAAERARLDATRALEDAKSTVEGLRRERDQLGKKGREQEERASRDATEARTEIQCATSPLPRLVNESCTPLAVSLCKPRVHLTGDMHAMHACNASCGCTEAL